MLQSCVLPDVLSEKSDSQRRRDSWRRLLLAALCLFSLMNLPQIAQSQELDQRVTMNLKNMSLDAALSMLAKQYELNMIVSGAKDVKLSLTLKDVTLKDALDGMLLPNGFNHFKRGDIIVVSSNSQAGLGSMTTLYYRLKFIPANVAQAAVESILSESGAAKILQGEDKKEIGPTVMPNALMIHDFPEVVTEAEALLAQIDKPERMVMIEVKMIETKIDSKDILGINWPKSITTRLTDVSGSAANTSSATGSTGTQTIGRAGFVDLPHGQWDWATLSVDELTMVIDFLQSSGKSKLISHPKLATLENHKAEFKVATIVPVQTVSRFTEGASTSDIVTFQDIEVGITLEVTPRINTEGVLTMDVFPRVQEIIGFSGTADQQKPITTERSVRTVVTCKDGETVVIGGLLRDNEIIIEEKIFLLGEIPILGGLFKHKRTEKESTDLLILITPTIM